MPKRYTGNYIVRWKNAKGEDQSKVYKSWALAQKAARYLANNGGVDIDIAIKQ